MRRLKFRDPAAEAAKEERREDRKLRKREREKERERRRSAKRSRRQGGSKRSRRRRDSGGGSDSGSRSQSRSRSRSRSASRSSGEEGHDGGRQVDEIKAFLSQPTVREQPVEKIRAYLQKTLQLSDAQCDAALAQAGLGATAAQDRDERTSSFAEGERVKYRHADGAEEEVVVVSVDSNVPAGEPPMVAVRMSSGGTRDTVLERLSKLR